MVADNLKKIKDLFSQEENLDVVPGSIYLKVCESWQKGEKWERDDMNTGPGGHDEFSSKLQHAIFSKFSRVYETNFSTKLLPNAECDQTLNLNKTVTFYKTNLL